MALRAYASGSIIQGFQGVSVDRKGAKKGVRATAGQKRSPQNDRKGEGASKLCRLTKRRSMPYMLCLVRDETQYEAIIVKRLNLSDEPSTAEIARFLEPAKNDLELKTLIAEVRKQGKRVFGEGFNIRLDETVISRHFRNRVFIRTA